MVGCASYGFAMAVTSNTCRRSGLINALLLFFAAFAVTLLLVHACFFLRPDDHIEEGTPLREASLKTDAYAPLLVAMPEAAMWRKV